jgi:hypothetical protein
MKYAIFLILTAVSLNAMADTYINGYIRDDGTYVEPHFRSDRNDSKYDNRSNSYESGLKDYKPRRAPVDNSYRLDKPFDTKDHSRNNRLNIDLD